MPALLNPRRERFCQAYADLGNACEAYRRSGYRSDNKRSLEVDSSRLLTFAEVKQRLTELKAQKLFQMQMEREELAGFYASVIKTPVGEIDAHHPLAQSHEITDKGVKVRMPDKVAAAAALSRLSGWDAASRVEISATNPLTDYLRSLRAADVQQVEDSHDQPL